MKEEVGAPSVVIFRGFLLPSIRDGAGMTEGDGFLL